MPVQPHSDPRTDAQLVDAINGGDFRAFEAIYHRYRDWVIGLAFRFTGHREDALDVCQETFAYLLRKFPGLKLSARLTTLLYPAVQHLARDARRKRARFAAPPQIREDAVTTGSQPAPDLSSTKAELSAVLGTLPDGQREVLLMRFVDDMTLPQIASALGIPVGTVKSRLHHGLQALRQDDRLRKYFEH